MIHEHLLTGSRQGQTGKILRLRRAKYRPTKDSQRQINERNAQRKLQRLILANFTTEDMETELIYPGEAAAEEAAEDLRGFLRQLRRIYQAAGSELKYIYLENQEKKSGRLIFNAGPLGREDLARLWGHGCAYSNRLRLDETWLDGLAASLTARSRTGQRQPGKRRWTPSRNLKRPELEISEHGEPA